MINYIREAGLRSAMTATTTVAMPEWLALLTPYLYKGVSDEAWPRVVQRYVEVIPKLVRLPADRLVRLDFETRAIAVREARLYATEPKVLVAIDGVLLLLDRAATGREVSNEEWSAELAKAEKEADEAKAEPSETAAKATACAVRHEPNSAVLSADEAAEAAWAAELSDWSCREAAWEAMADAMLTAWELAV